MPFYGRIVPFSLLLRRRSAPEKMPTAPTEIIDSLQASIRLHWTAVENYLSQGEHFARWGYGLLAERFRGDAEEERGHLVALMARLEYFDAAPSFVHQFPTWPRHDVPGILAYNLELERKAAEVERANVIAARAYGCETTAGIFAALLKDSEESIERIEADQKLIEAIGLENWLANHIG
jgi:bacterioferritin (cytochrome b1)